VRGPAPRRRRTSPGTIARCDAAHSTRTADDSATSASPCSPAPRAPPAARAANAMEMDPLVSTHLSSALRPVESDARRPRAAASSSMPGVSDPPRAGCWPTGPPRRSSTCCATPARTRS
jgi:hypothetical protein